MKYLIATFLFLGALPVEALEMKRESVKFDFNQKISEIQTEEKSLSEDLGDLLDQADDSEVSEFIRHEAEAGVDVIVKKRTN